MSGYEAINFLAVGACVLAAAGLLVKRPRFRGAVLALLLLFGGYCHLMVFLFETGLFPAYPLLAALYFSHIPPGILTGPLLYFHARSVAGGPDRISGRDALHFIPAIAAAASVVPYLGWDFEKKISFIDGYMKGQNPLFQAGLIVMVAYYVFYGALSLATVLRVARRGNPLHARLLVIEGMLACFIVFILLKVVAIVSLSPRVMVFENVATSLLFLATYLAIHRYPGVFRHATLSRATPAAARSQLGGIDLETLGLQLDALMREERFYCDEGLTLKKLADAMEVTPHQLSEYLNEHHGKNFNSYVNGYRVEEAKRLLLGGEGMNTLHVAYAAGFNSYTAFYNAFRKITGMSPAEFRSESGKE